MVVLSVPGAVSLLEGNSEAVSIEHQHVPSKSSNHSCAMASEETWKVAFPQNEAPQNHHVV